MSQYGGIIPYMDSSFVAANFFKKEIRNPPAFLPRPLLRAGESEFRTPPPFPQKNEAGCGQEFRSKKVRANAKITPCSQGFHAADLLRRNSPHVFLHAAESFRIKRSDFLHNVTRVYACDLQRTHDRRRRQSSCLEIGNYDVVWPLRTFRACDHKNPTYREIIHSPWPSVYQCWSYLGFLAIRKRKHRHNDVSVLKRLHIHLSKLS